jgi:DNA-directed RNA polymerase subunit beta
MTFSPYSRFLFDDYSIVRDTKLGNEDKLTNDIPNVSEEATKDLDENGMIRTE